METRTVKPPKALPNTFRKVMPALVIANKHSQGKKDLGDPTSRVTHEELKAKEAVSVCIAFENARHAAAHRLIQVGAFLHY